MRNRKAYEPTLVEVAKKLGKSTAQVLIRYCIQKGWVPLPKSETEERIKENADVFGWEIGPRDMEILDHLGDGGDEAIVQSVD